MIKVYKNVGETPLELIERIRKERPELEKERLSYAGRLDPMAEGEMIILVGEENNHREKYLGADKEYVATFLVGVSTDSGDILGLTTNKSMDPQYSSGDDAFGVVIPEAVSGIQALEKNLEKIKNIKKQTYPWFSGKTVNGKKLFEYFKEGDLSIDRPTLDVEIKESKLIVNSQKSKEEIKKYIFESVGKVKGDFRQEEILDKWSGAFGAAPQTLQTFEVKLLVSSGTFIRALTEEFSFPVCLLKLKRTKVFI